MIKEMMQQLISNIESINKSLEIIAENGIHIIDTYNLITICEKICTIIFPSIFGGWITLQLFKRQEKIRIREKIRLDFYKQYEELYELVLEEFFKYKSEILRISSFFAVDNNGNVKHIIDSISNQEDVKRNYELMKDSIKFIKNIKESLEKLEYFMDSKKTITGYDEYKYSEIKRKVKKYKRYFGELSLRYDVICPNEELIRSYEKIGVSNEIKQEDESEKNNMIEKYKETLVKIYKANNMFESLLKDMQNINEGIEKEFIGGYFEKKRVNFIIKYIKRFFKKIINSILEDE